MNYRHLGKAGIQVSELSFGSWVTFHNQADIDATMQMMEAAYDAGVNFFDNAEVYASGRSEELMGEALRRLGWLHAKRYGRADVSRDAHPRRARASGLKTINVA